VFALCPYLTVSYVEARVGDGNPRTPPYYRCLLDGSIGKEGCLGYGEGGVGNVGSGLRRSFISSLRDSFEILLKLTRHLRAGLYDFAPSGLERLIVFCA